MFQIRVFQRHMYVFRGQLFTYGVHAVNVLKYVPLTFFWVSF